MSGRLKRVFERLPSAVVIPVAIVLVLVLFLFAVQLLGAATGAARPTLRRLLTRVVVGDSSALGLSWLAAYALGNGSVVAALALSLFDSGLVSTPQLFLMVAGSRLGAAGIVLFIGALEFVQKARYSLRKAVSMGLLTFLLTLSIYLPVTLLGYLALPLTTGPVSTVTGRWTLGSQTGSLFEPIVTGVTATVGPLPSFLLAVAVLFGSLRLFDRVLGQVDTGLLRDRLFSHFRRTWLSFAIGLVITTVTTSVAFSLGVIVPLYNRGYVKRDELVPYVLGANLGTLFDTLLVAIVLQTPVGIATVLTLLGIATGITIAVLLVHDQYVGAIGTVDDRLSDDRRAFTAFVAALVLVPALLLLVPLLL